MRLYEAKKLEQSVKESQMVNELVCKALCMVTQSHVWHLQTKSYAAHKALNEFYETMQDKADELAEIFLGGGGKLTFHGQDIKNFVSVDDTRTQLQDFKSELVTAETELMQDENSAFHAVGDTILDIVKETDKVLYLLTLE